MRAARRSWNSLLTDVARWLVLLAVLALIAVLASGAPAVVLTLCALAVWIAALARSRRTLDPGGWPGRDRGVLFAAQLAPALVGLVIADEIAADDWYAFTAVAIAFPLALISRALFDRRGGASPRRAS